ncbi:hypothetical protein TREMEDRAFT_59739 [Tremella mesenterica DSM 1558]|uniref:uncharacterized protein n=1 Tax=Tremella mesenterica (strain ATCC 24925 / CBS 8224 / DSM 1558 / NBRC 9311 / NRRL Y-6157 / RJB 2259-6 / UBC 559-6) TaxID=578456 RepID=UPI0003F4948C|nr:uncharacterized protein TREMEDRAFT_59739 [Tremella mesenterica DSM 1558]EIW73561.1 hypothetical protein TREMEDRAFT_59739 [Tremella mesenterica DSM 1558]
MSSCQTTTFGRGGCRKVVGRAVVSSNTGEANPHRPIVKSEVMEPNLSTPPSHTPRFPPDPLTPTTGVISATGAICEGEIHRHCNGTTEVRVELYGSEGLFYDSEKYGPGIETLLSPAKESCNGSLSSMKQEETDHVDDDFYRWY